MRLNLDRQISLYDFACSDFGTNFIHRVGRNSHFQKNWFLWRRIFYSHTRRDNANKSCAIVTIDTAEHDIWGFSFGVCTRAAASNKPAKYFPMTHRWSPHAEQDLGCLCDPLAWDHVAHAQSKTVFFSGGCADLRLRAWASLWHVAGISDWLHSQLATRRKAFRKPKGPSNADSGSPS